MKELMCAIAIGLILPGVTLDQPDPCTVPDNGSGTVTLSPAGCQYLSPTDVHTVIDGLPPGTTVIELGRLPVTGQIDIPRVLCEVHTGLTNPGGPVETFISGMVMLEGGLAAAGERDVSRLNITAGRLLGPQSPGQMTLTQWAPGRDWTVDSFFDNTYQIDFVGAPAGAAGSTVGTLRLSGRAGPSVPGPGPTLTLELAEPTSCFNDFTPPPVPTGLIHVNVRVSNLSCPITGAQVFLRFDATCWRVWEEQSEQGIAAGPEWIELGQKVCNEVRLPECPEAGIIEYGVSRFVPSQADSLLATITMLPVAENCACSMWFDTPRPPDLPDNSLTCGNGSIISSNGIVFEDDAVNGAVTLDETPPDCTPPPDITTNADPGLCSAAIDPGSPVCTDNCDTNGIDCTCTRSDDPTLSCSADPYPVGVTTLTWVCVDDCGNTSTSTQTVTVIDAEPPDIVCPGDISVATDPGMCSAVVDPGMATCTDNCVICTVSCERSDGLDCFTDRYPVGDTTLTWTATDTAGNTRTCTQTISVRDAENPGITCPAAITVNTDPASCTAAVDPGTATCSDNCVNCTVSCARDDGLDCLADPYRVGTTTLTWTATDGAGNTHTCQQTITVIDAEPPVITCPNAITADTDPGSCTAAVNPGMATCTDNCVACTVSCERSDGLDCLAAPYPVGPTILIWTATDDAGNTAKCQQTVTVVDAERPVIDCPPDITISADPGLCSAVVNPDPATCTDNCGFCKITCRRSDGLDCFTDPYPVGDTILTWAAEDTVGNSRTCTQRITVNDAEAPTITCPANITTDADIGTCGAVVTWPLPPCDDNCPGCMVTCSPPPGSLFPVGTNAVECIATDPAGNVSSCGFSIVVIDAEEPTITCPPDITTNANTNACSAMVDPGMASCMDNCVNCMISCSRSDGLDCFADPYPLGCTDVHWTATDDASNTNGCVQRICVLDTEPPHIICPPFIYANANTNATTNGCRTQVDWFIPCSDNCGVCGPVICTPPSGSLFPVGTTPVACGVEDASGNVTTCGFPVIVEDAGSQITVLGLALEPSVWPAACTRCITFELFGCATGERHVIDLDITFFNGIAGTVTLSAPCADYTCLTVRDPLHTLRRTAPLQRFGNDYVADLAAQPLIGGNTNDDCFIDILDWVDYFSMFGTNGIGANTPCGTLPPHPDFNCNGNVDLGAGLIDLSFISVHFFEWSELHCCGAEPLCDPTAPAGSGQPRASATVQELSRLGYSNAAMADLNNDGWVDLDDVEAFVSGIQPTDLMEIDGAEPAPDPTSPR